MRIKHKFVDVFSCPISISECLNEDDFCIYCNFKIDKNTEQIFFKMLQNHSLDSDMDIYKSDLNFCYKIVNERFPCLTEEEFIIKSLLE